MISITLQFATMQEAADALARFTPTPAAAAVQATAAIEKAKVEAPKPVDAKASASAAGKQDPAKSSPATGVDAATTTAPATAEAKTEALSYDMVSKAITDKVKSNRDHVVATLAKFGVKKGTELKAEQYEEFLAAL